jgi:hypothetical protein
MVFEAIQTTKKRGKKFGRPDALDDKAKEGDAKDIDIQTRKVA